MKKMFFTLLAITSMFYMGHAALPGPYTLPYVGTAPTIDGDASDWGTTWLNMDSIVQNTAFEAGMSAKFQTSYDTQNLYFIFDVKDATMGDTAASFGSWNSDCVEVMLSLDTASSGGITGMYQFRHLEGKNDSALFDGTIFGSGVSIANWNANPNMKVSEVDAGDGYVNEWQIPWDSLMVRMDTAGAGRGPWDKKEFKLEVQVSDNTGTNRTQQAFWAGTSNSAWNNSAYQRVVKLQYPLAVAQPQIAGTVTMSHSGNLLKISKTVATVSVFDVTGKLIMVANNVNTVNTSNLNKGLYIARTGNTSLKFVKR